MKVFFRVDASVRMGTGHLIRCLTLAEKLRERGVELRFICREYDGNLLTLLHQMAMPVTVLPAPAIVDQGMSEDYAEWLGVTQMEDAEQTIKALEGEQPDWLVVDHYGLDIEWERRIRPQVRKLMVIDDLANRHHVCDVLLDQNYSSKGIQRYSGLVPEYCRLLLGPRYALIRSEYAAYRKTQNYRDGRVRRVLVFFGGSDPENLTGAALDALSDINFKHLYVDVVVGANYHHREKLERQASKRSKTKIYGPRPHLADLMAQAEIAIGACGTTTWERMCLGLPAVLVSIAENQRPASQALNDANLICYAGHFTEFNVDHLKTLFLAQIQCPERLADLAIQNKLQVDGLGVLRLVEVIIPTASHEIRLRPACEEDISFYYNGECSASSTSLITWSTYNTWYTGKLLDEGSRLFVLEAKELPVGQIRFETERDEASIDYSLDPIVKERGWDSRIIALGVGVMRQIEPLRLNAEMKAGNKVSSAVFLRMGRLENLQRPSLATGYSIAILSDKASWMNEYLEELLMEWLIAGHRVMWCHDKKELQTGDFCFYLSCGQIVPISILSLFRNNLVIHESNLPMGKGWSPLTWQILEGAARIPVTLFEAAESVDSGDIYAQEWLEFEGHELINELRAAQAKATIKLCKRFIAEYPRILDDTRKQVGDASSYSRRHAADSELALARSLESQFDLLRVVDNQRYPAFFQCRDHWYVLKIEKVDKP